MDTPETHTRLITLGEMSTALEFTDVRVTLIACRNTASARALRKFLKETNVSLLLIEGLYGLKRGEASKAYSPMTVVDPFQVHGGNICVLVWSFPTVGLSLVACCRKPVNEHDVRARDFFTREDVSKMILNNFFPRRTKK